MPKTKSVAKRNARALPPTKASQSQSSPRASRARRATPDRAAKLQHLAESIKRARERAGLTLAMLSDAVQKSTGTTISPVQLSRIERGLTPPDALELIALTSILGIEIADLMTQAWFVMRERDMFLGLDEVKAGKKETSVRLEKAHFGMDNYKYLPINHGSPFSNVAERSPFWARPRLMQAQLFSVSPRPPDALKFGFHPGEEIIYVLTGDIEFWYEVAAGKREYVSLHRGDFLQFSAYVPHAFSARSNDATALFILANQLETTPAVALLKKNGDES